MRPTEESLAIKAKKQEEHRRKSRNGFKILTIDTSRVCDARRGCEIETRYHRDRFLSLGIAEYVGNVKSVQHRLMNQMLSLSTGSEFLRPRKRHSL